MEESIWKYELPIEDQFVLQLPVDSKVLSLQMQNGIPCIWVRVNTKAIGTLPQYFHWFGTGQPLNSGAVNFIGTIQMDTMVFHLFQED